MPTTTTVIVHTTVQSSGLATTILAAFGVLLALGSLAWQAYTFYRSGSRVRVVLRSGATNGQQVATFPGVPSEQDRRLLATQGLTQAIFGVEVSNAGRGATSIQSVDLLFPKGASFTGQFVGGSPDLPFRMDGETEKTWYFDAETAKNVGAALNQATSLGPSLMMRGRVKLAGKKPVVSKNSIQVL